MKHLSLNHDKFVEKVRQANEREEQRALNEEPYVPTSYPVFDPLVIFGFLLLLVYLTL